MSISSQALDSKKQEIPEWLLQVSQSLTQVKGVTGVVLGGSRARGRAKADSDYDIGIYYQPETFDWNGLKKTAEIVDDSHKPQGLASPGEWGPWINGGGWLTIQKQKVDFLLRDYKKVAQVVSDCENGTFTTHYQVGHPNAFYSYIWMAEMHIGLPIQDPYHEIQSLRQRTVNYPPLLQKAIVNQYYFEAEFTLSILRKVKERNDPYYINGLVFRLMSCMIQVIFALNKQYFMNEKASVELIGEFTLAPPRFPERVKKITHFIPEIHERESWLAEMQDLLADLDRCKKEIF